MKKILLTVACVFVNGAALAGPVDNACMRAGRTSDAALCGCIQQVADQTLSRADQRRAADFFQNPDKAQQVRASSRASDNDFWARYKNFAATAEAYCGG